MPAPQQGGGGQGSDNSAAMLWSVAAIFATIGAVWYVFKNKIVIYYLTTKLYEVNFLTFLSNQFHFNSQPLVQLHASLLYALATPATIKFNDLVNLGGSVGTWFRLPLVLLLVALGIIVYISSNSRVFRREYSMRDLAKVEQVNWPQITPILKLDLLKVDIETGPWAMAMTPMQFCKRYRLLEEVRPQRHEGMSRHDWDRMEVVLKRGEANKLFALQLGPMWKGTAALPPYMRALFAVFAARINADTPPATQLLMQLAASASGTLNYSGTDALLKKHENTKLVQQIVQAHAYVLTVMASMLEAAREDGVQASSDFLWLKPVDRKLWYTLNTVGRQTPFIEVAGIFAHWLAEKEAGNKILVPMVDEATHAVQLALKEVIYRPDETT